MNPVSPEASQVADAVLQLHDTQASGDHRRIAIDKVGVRGVTYPIRVIRGDESVLPTVATVNMYVDLAHFHRGTHMSRFVEILNAQDAIYTAQTFLETCHQIQDRLGAETAFLEMEFPYFLERYAPVTGMPSMMDYKAAVEVRATREQRVLDLMVRVPAKSLCPCSKRISDYGAHNQRCEISIRTTYSPGLWFDDLIEMAEKSASSPVYSLLKRPDERHVTESAYDNPKFVEDLIRDLALQLNEDPRITRYSISARNFESIHNHDAYAFIEHDKQSR